MSEVQTANEKSATLMQQRDAYLSESTNHETDEAHSKKKYGQLLTNFDLLTSEKVALDEKCKQLDDEIKELNRVSYHNENELSVKVDEYSKQLGIKLQVLREYLQ